MADEVVSIMDEFVHALNPPRSELPQEPKYELFLLREKNPKP